MSPHETGSPQSPSSSRSRGALLTFILLFFTALDIGLLCFALAQPFDGFHGFQEAGYAAIARNYSTQPLFPSLFYEVGIPPLFSYFVLLSFSVFGQTEFAARLVPVTFALLSMLGAYLLGRKLAWKRAGLEAAGLMASTPIFLILGRSVQTDIVFVAFSLFALYFYMKAREKWELRRSLRIIPVCLAGLFLGASLFTKQFAVLPLAAIITWELLGHERRRLVSRDFILFLLVAGLVVAPYYGYHLLHDPERLIDAQLHGSASKAGLATGLTLSFLVSEMLWGCSPLFLIGSLAGLGLALVRPNRNNTLIALVIGFYFVFYLFFHRHTYYFLGMVPFLSLCFIQLSERLPKKVYAGSLVLTLATGTLFSAYQLAGCKYGFGEYKAIGDYLRPYRHPVVMADSSFYYNYEPLFKYYAENATLILHGSDPSPSEKEALRNSDAVFSFSDVPLGGNTREFPIKGIRYGVKLGNHIYIHIPPNLHFFTPALPTEVTDYTILSSFGPFVKLEQTSFYIVAEPTRLRSLVEGLWDALKERFRQGFR